MRFLRLFWLKIFPRYQYFERIRTTYANADVLMNSSPLWPEEGKRVIDGE